MSAPDSPTNVDGTEVAAQLQPVLVDLVALALNGKQAHWHVYGRQFTAIHERLDVLVDDARTYADEIAERIVALGVYVDGRPRTVADAGADLPEGWLPDDKVIALVVELLDATIARARQTLGPLESIDQVSQDIVVGLVRTLEKHRWMFAAGASS